MSWPRVWKCRQFGLKRFREEAMYAKHWRVSPHLHKQIFADLRDAKAPWENPKDTGHSAKGRTPNQE